MINPDVAVSAFLYTSFKDSVSNSFVDAAASTSQNE